MVRNAGEEVNTVNPGIIAYALDLLQLRKPRKRADGGRANPDYDPDPYKPCVALSEPTELERKMAEQAAVELKVPFTGVRFIPRPTLVTLTPESVKELAEVLQGEAPPAAAPAAKARAIK